MAQYLVTKMSLRTCEETDLGLIAAEGSHMQALEVAHAVFGDACLRNSSDTEILHIVSTEGPLKVDFADRVSKFKLESK